MRTSLARFRESVPRYQCVGERVRNPWPLRRRSPTRACRARPAGYGRYCATRSADPKLTQAQPQRSREIELSSPGPGTYSSSPRSISAPDLSPAPRAAESDPPATTGARRRPSRRRGCRATRRSGRVRETPRLEPFHPAADRLKRRERLPRPREVGVAHVRMAKERRPQALAAHGHPRGVLVRERDRRGASDPHFAIEAQRRGAFPWENSVPLWLPYRNGIATPIASAGGGMPSRRATVGATSIARTTGMRRPALTCGPTA